MMTFLEKSLENLPDDASKDALLSDEELDNVAGGATDDNMDKVWCPGCKAYVPSSVIVNRQCTRCWYSFGDTSTSA